MDVEPCYLLFSAELESTEALASSQQKFQTLNLADYRVMSQLLPMTLVCQGQTPSADSAEKEMRLLFILWNAPV